MSPFRLMIAIVVSFLQTLDGSTLCSPLPGVISHPILQVSVAGDPMTTGMRQSACGRSHVRRYVRECRSDAFGRRCASEP